jgi:hypothetical protein
MKPKHCFYNIIWYGYYAYNKRLDIRTRTQRLGIEHTVLQKTRIEIDLILFKGEML